MRLEYRHARSLIFCVIMPFSKLQKNYLLFNFRYQFLTDLTGYLIPLFIRSGRNHLNWFVFENVFNIEAQYLRCRGIPF